VNFRDLLEAAPDAMVGVDRGGLIQFVNRHTESLFGYPRGALVGLPIETLVPESFRTAHRAHRANQVEVPKARPIGVGRQLTGRRRDGTEFSVDISLSHFGAGDGRVVIAAVRDLTPECRTAACCPRKLAGLLRVSLHHPKLAR